MTYIKCKWNHTFRNDPVTLYSELDDQRRELRKVEVFRDGRMGFADGQQEFGGASLGLEPVPPLAEIAADTQFEPVEITRLEFESVWSEAVARAPSGPHEQILQQRRELKAQYGQLFDSIADLLFRHDPARINFEINPDEYQYEAEKILPRLRACQSAEDVQQLVHEQLVGSFDLLTAGPPQRYSQIASEIWQLWKTHQATRKMP